MNDLVAEIERALATVQRTLDRLTADGQDELAFRIAQLQFAASVRASWPGNLTPLASALDEAADRVDLGLPEDERAAIRRASATLRKLVG